MIFGLLLLAGCVGQTLDWVPTGTADWRIGETLTSENPEGDGYLVSDAVYDDFELTIEFKPDASVNSGILIHCQDRNDITPLTCLEINIWDDHPNQDFRTGAIVIHAAPPLAQMDSVGHWNRYRIVARGTAVEAWLNGVLTARLNDAVLTKGFIALQSQNGEVSFRNARIR
ncbi:MAG: DUF1080 domain-containing protein [Pseudomonadales bacterium]|nr:DUF1080 domain-containing protein [Pseudomonadales bacterium]MBO6595488.1 DUF1080 domain-containing protein [Pseudomonadales bacterium]MBO6658628.1 DUF1080 domain-containing protein [Pseudomonadales bacterium]MBO6701988.1 DUF1080 domain-containing protein [Pseudomonadales bacterium]MBO6820953.1 DUF1080 domain-containing protein [Pseudomonadales bacterium]